MSQPTYGQAAMRGRFAQAQWLTAEIAHSSQRIGLDRHPFIERWSAGMLTSDELRLFAAEHHHAICALAEVANRAAAMTDGLLGEQLAHYATHRDHCIELSCEFALATGWPRAAWYFAEDPGPQTAACAHAWSGDHRSLGRHLVTIHAIESAFAQLAALQRDALRDRYGFDEPGTRYFAVHAMRAADDAATAAAALTGILPLLSPVALVRHAELALQTYLGLLDGLRSGARAPRSG